MKRKWKILAVIVVLFLALMGAAYLDYQTSVKAGQAAQALRELGTKNLAEETTDLLDDWTLLRQQRKYGIVFGSLVLIIVAGLVFSVGPAQKVPERVPQKEARRLAREFDQMYREEGTFVEAAPENAELELLPDSLATPRLVDARYEAHGVTFTWEGVDYAQGYSVWKKSQGERWKRIATVGADQLSYVDYQLADSTLYMYSVKAFMKNNGKRIVSRKDPLGKEVFVQEGNIPHVPKISAGRDGQGRDCVMWTGVAKAGMYRILRREPGEDWEKLAKISADLPHVFYDDSAQRGQAYDYSVMAGRRLHKQMIVSDFDQDGVRIQY